MPKSVQIPAAKPIISEVKRWAYKIVVLNSLVKFLEDEKGLKSTREIVDASKPDLSKLNISLATIMEWLLLEVYGIKPGVSDVVQLLEKPPRLGIAELLLRKEGLIFYGMENIPSCTKFDELVTSVKNKKANPSITALAVDIARESKSSLTKEEVTPNLSQKSKASATKDEAASNISSKPKASATKDGADSNNISRKPKAPTKQNKVVSNISSKQKAPTEQNEVTFYHESFDRPLIHLPEFYSYYPPPPMPPHPAFRHPMYAPPPHYPIRYPMTPPLPHGKSQLSSKDSQKKSNTATANSTTAQSDKAIGKSLPIQPADPSAATVSPFQFCTAPIEPQNTVRITKRKYTGPATNMSNNERIRHIEYKPILVRMMNYLFEKEDDIFHEYTKDELCELTPELVLRFFHLEAFGETDDIQIPYNKEPIVHFITLRSKRTHLNFFMPDKKMRWDPIKETGNPLKCDEMDKLLEYVRDKEGYQPPPPKKKRKTSSNLSKAECRPPTMSKEEHKKRMEQCRPKLVKMMKFLRGRDYKKSRKFTREELKITSEEAMKFIHHVVFGKEDPVLPYEDEPLLKFGTITMLISHISFFMPPGKYNDEDGSGNPLKCEQFTKMLEYVKKKENWARPPPPKTSGPSLKQQLQELRAQVESLTTSHSQLKAEVEFSNRRCDALEAKLAAMERSGNLGASAAAQHDPAEDSDDSGEVMLVNKNAPAVLTSLKLIPSLETLWMEYEYGLGGKKPARFFTSAERSTAHDYFRRDCFWKLVVYLQRHGIGKKLAIRHIEQAYLGRSLSAIIELIREDRVKVPQQETISPEIWAKYRFPKLESLPNVMSALEAGRQKLVAKATDSTATTQAGKQTSETKLDPVEDDINDEETHEKEDNGAQESVNPLTVTLVDPNAPVGLASLRSMPDLFTLWMEYEYGLEGRKPAKHYTSAEKQSVNHSSRNCFWLLVVHLQQLGVPTEKAISLIQRIYGAKTIGQTLKLIRADRVELKSDGDGTGKGRGVPKHYRYPRLEANPDAIKAIEEGKPHRKVIANDVPTPDATAKLALIKDMKDGLFSLWLEYEEGLDGNKPAKLFTKREISECSQYRQRMIVWRCMLYLIDIIKLSPIDACNKIEEAYSGGVRIGDGASLSRIRRNIYENRVKLTSEEDKAKMKCNFRYPRLETVLDTCIRYKKNHV